MIAPKDRWVGFAAQDKKKIAGIDDDDDLQLIYNSPVV